MSRIPTHYGHEHHHTKKKTNIQTQTFLHLKALSLFLFWIWWVIRYIFQYLWIIYYKYLNMIFSISLVWTLVSSAIDDASSRVMLCMNLDKAWVKMHVILLCVCFLRWILKSAVIDRSCIWTLLGISFNWLE